MSIIRRDNFDLDPPASASACTAGSHNNPKAIVLDSGSFLTRAGFAGEQGPRICFRSVVGREGGDLCFGEEALFSDTATDVACPIDGDTVTNWEDLEKLWDFAFKKLKVDPKDHSVILTSTPSDIMSAAGYKSTREKMAQILFEKFDCPKIFIANQPVLALYAAGHMEGFVVNCGHQRTQCVPVEKGFAVPEAVTIVNYAGRDVSNFFAKSLGDRIPSSTRVEMEVVGNMKEKLGYVSMKLEQELKKPAAKIEESYKLPSGQEITVGNERFQCPEALFRPSLLGVESAGIPEACYNSIMKCKEETRKTMFDSIILSGGSTLFPGFNDRFTAEMMALSRPANRPKVIAPANRPDSVWSGASILAALENFQTMWVSKKEYEESGTSVLHEKCR